MTEQFIEYTQARKADSAAAKTVERETPTLDVRSVAGAAIMKLPKLAGRTITRDDVTIAYKKPRREFKEVAEALGNFGMSAPDVGRLTFEYFRKMEMGK